MLLILFLFFWKVLRILLKRLSELNQQLAFEPPRASEERELTLSLQVHGSDGDERAARMIFNETHFLFCSFASCLLRARFPPRNDR